MERLILRMNACHENWDGMSSVEKGRFCAVCHKKVVDLSSADKRTILGTIQSAGNSICVRFTKNAAVSYASRVELWRSKVRFLPLIMSLIIFYFNVFFAKAQQIQPTTAKKNPMGTARKKQFTVCTIRGSVKDSASREYLPGAVVSLFQNEKLISHTATDPEGNFRFDLSGDTLLPDTFSLRVDYLGYKRLEMKKIALNKRYFIFNLELKEQPLEITVQVIGHKDDHIFMGVIPLQENRIEAWGNDPFMINYYEWGTHYSHKAIQKMP